jgi:hypothetical protein
MPSRFRGTYTREEERATMIEITLDVYVEEDVAERLGLLR